MGSIGESNGGRNEAGAAHKEGRKISRWCQKERWRQNDKTRRPQAIEQNTAASNKRFAIAAPIAAVTSRGNTNVTPIHEPGQSKILGEERKGARPKFNPITRANESGRNGLAM
jgi:hypothetical protein